MRDEAIKAVTSIGLALQEQIDDLRTQCGSAPARALLGQDSERQPGGVALRATANASAA